MKRALFCSVSWGSTRRGLYLNQFLIVRVGSQTNFTRVLTNVKGGSGLSRERRDGGAAAHRDRGLRGLDGARLDRQTLSGLLLYVIIHCQDFYFCYHTMSV